MNVLKIIRNFISRKPQTTEAPTLTVPTGAALIAELNAYEPLVARAADAEGWDNLRTEELLDLANLATPEAWYTQLQQAAPLIEAERAHLAAALSHMDECAWPLTSAEYATATAAMALTMLVWSWEVE